MGIRERLSDWVIILMSGTILIAALYTGYCDVLDGRYINPIIEMGTRSQLYTHQTTKSTYHPGETVYAKILFQKNRNLTGTLQWHLINHRMTTYAARIGSLPVGIWDKVVVVETIPEDTHPGTHWFCGTVTYHPNWLGIVEYPIWSNKFEVVKK